MVCGTFKCSQKVNVILDGRWICLSLSLPCAAVIQSLYNFRNKSISLAFCCASDCFVGLPKYNLNLCYYKCEIRKNSEIAF